MAVTEETLRYAGDIRVVIDRHVDDATRDLVVAWGRTWRTLIIDWDLARRQIVAARADGGRPTRAQILRFEKVTQAVAATRQALDDLAARTSVRVLQDAEQVLRLTADAQTQIIGSQLPPGSTGGILRASLVRVDQAQIEWIMARITEQVTSKVLQFGPVGEQIMLDELIRGVAVGLNPRNVASEFMAAADFIESMQHAFTATLNDALVIARTELLDATRAAAAAGQAANANVLTGWMWLAKLDTRTCPSCWGQHGTVHDLTEGGPDDHQQGRCARMPVVKPWKELGFAIPEPPSVVPDAEAVFAGFGPAEQLKVMGRARLDALQAGEITWSQLSMVRHTRGWRRSFVPAPVSTIRRRRLRRVV